MTLAIELYLVWNLRSLIIREILAALNEKTIFVLCGIIRGPTCPAQSDIRFFMVSSRFLVEKGLVI